MTVPKLIRAVKRKLDLTDEELAARLKVTDRTIRNWKTGTIKPRPGVVMELRAMVEQQPGEGR